MVAAGGDGDELGGIGGEKWDGEGETQMTRMARMGMELKGDWGVRPVTLFRVRRERVSMGGDR